GAPIVFIGVGEHPDDLEKFDPPRFISRLLGMGDLQSLLERAKEVVDEEKAEEVAKKIITGKFTLIEMREQMEMLTKMGPLKKIMSLFPSFGGRFNPMAMEGETLEETQRKLKTFKVIMNSMTEEELKNPRIIKSSRIKRISRGAGVTQKEVKELLNYYNKMLKTMKSIQGNRRMRKQLMKQLRIEGLDEL
ncbi:MAG TPA: signal recognition particle protein Srp19, partial [Euryarchaeota archaeon]|nr:signal recognition particle protein Srp19 [Euryarchaeota archaeon]